MSLSARREALARIHGGYPRAGRPHRTRTKETLRAEHAQLDPFVLKKSIELKLKKFFTALGNLNREATKP
jgi:hypothetical protein